MQYVSAVSKPKYISHVGIHKHKNAMTTATTTTTTTTTQLDELASISLVFFVIVSADCVVGDLPDLVQLAWAGGNLVYYP